jgi:hypothetical protein
VAYCAEKEWLWDALTDASGRLRSLRGRQIQTVIEGDADEVWFEALIEVLSEKKRQAKDAYITHVRLHGC